MSHDLRNLPANPYPPPTEKLEDREMYPFAVTRTGPLPNFADRMESADQPALPLGPDRIVPRYDTGR